MFHVDNSSGASTMPPLAPAQSATPTWFTEGDRERGVSYIGQDWLNIVQAELLGILDEAHIRPDKSRLNQLSLAIKGIIAANAYTRDSNLSEIRDDGANAQAAARSHLGLGALATRDNLDAAEVGALSADKNGADIPDKNAFLQNVGAVPVAGSAAMTGVFRTDGEFQQRSPGGVVRGWRMIAKDTATYWRLSSQGYGGRSGESANRLHLYSIWKPGVDVYGTNASATLLEIDVKTANITCSGDISTNGTVTPGSYANFDSRYLREGQQQAIRDASTSQKGIVQLSDSLASTSSALAATPRAVKEAYDVALDAIDVARRKYTAQDASTSRKGIVQLTASMADVDRGDTSRAVTPDLLRQAMDQLRKEIDRISNTPPPSITPPKPPRGIANSERDIGSAERGGVGRN